MSSPAAQNKKKTKFDKFIDKVIADGSATLGEKVRMALVAEGFTTYEDLAEENFEALEVKPGEKNLVIRTFKSFAKAEVVRDPDQPKAKAAPIPAEQLRSLLETSSMPDMSSVADAAKEGQNAGEADGQDWVPFDVFAWTPVEALMLAHRAGFLRARSAGKMFPFSNPLTAKSAPPLMQASVFNSLTLRSNFFVPDIVLYPEHTYTFDTNVSESTSMSTFFECSSAAVAVEGSYGSFSASLNAEIGKQTETVRKGSSFCVVATARANAMRLNLRDVLVVEPRVEAEFAAAVKSPNADKAIDQLVLKYGFLCVIDGIVGVQAIAKHEGTASEEMSSTAISGSIAASVSGSFLGASASASAAYAQQNSSQSAASKVASSMTVNVQGAPCAVCLQTMPNVVKYAGNIRGVDLIDIKGVVPLFDLFEDKQVAAEAWGHISDNVGNENAAKEWGMIATRTRLFAGGSRSIDQKTDYISLCGAVADSTPKILLSSATVKAGCNLKSFAVENGNIVTAGAVKCWDSRVPSNPVRMKLSLWGKTRVRVVLRCPGEVGGASVTAMNDNCVNPSQVVLTAAHWVVDTTNSNIRSTAVEMDTEGDTVIELRKPDANSPVCVSELIVFRDGCRLEAVFNGWDFFEDPRRDAGTNVGDIALNFPNHSHLNNNYFNFNGATVDSANYWSYHPCWCSSTLTIDVNLPELADKTVPRFVVFLMGHDNTTYEIAAMDANQQNIYEYLPNGVVGYCTMNQTSYKNYKLVVFRQTVSSVRYRIWNAKNVKEMAHTLGVMVMSDMSKLLSRKRVA